MRVFFLLSLNMSYNLFSTAFESVRRGWTVGVLKKSKSVKHRLHREWKNKDKVEKVVSASPLPPPIILIFLPFLSCPPPSYSSTSVRSFSFLVWPYKWVRYLEETCSLSLVFKKKLASKLFLICKCCRNRKRTYWIYSLATLMIETPKYEKLL
jgi:hypothetical protein